MRNQEKQSVFCGAMSFFQKHVPLIFASNKTSYICTSTPVVSANVTVDPLFIKFCVQQDHGHFKVGQAPAVIAVGEI